MSFRRAACVAILLATFTFATQSQNSSVAKGSDGKIMEMNPRPVEIPVKRQVGESYSGQDSQLDTAVDELLRQIGKKKL